MGLYTDLNTALKGAYSGDLEDAVYPLNLVKSQDNYNVTLGEVQVTKTTAITRGVPTIVTNDLVDGEVIRATDTQFIIIQSELSETPEIDDIITYANIDYTINSIIPDPVGVIWQLVGRAV